MLRVMLRVLDVLEMIEQETDPGRVCALGQQTGHKIGWIAEPVTANFRRYRLEAKDTGFSSRQQGFDSPYRLHYLKRG